MSLLADALDLHHRLPRLWVKVELLEVPGWKARRVAELTRKLRRAGDVDTLRQRKAKALGSIAEAQDTLDIGGLDKLDHRITAPSPPSRRSST
ncbi:hypothetical protein ACLM5J_19390 [Nocardioides sp. Bht2]|uniref:hypothetical protein n=1 Tax=Nocardioides sp. Bht2 TaxID=3392297 RepID=UPI0039B3A0FD